MADTETIKTLRKILAKTKTGISRSISNNRSSQIVAIITVTIEAVENIIEGVVEEAESREDGAEKVVLVAISEGEVLVAEENGAHNTIRDFFVF